MITRHTTEYSMSTIRMGALGLMTVATMMLVACESENPDAGTLSWGGPTNISMLLIIAEKNGYFDDVGLVVSSNYLQTGKIAMDAVVSGDIDIGVLVDTNIAFVGFQKGAEIAVVASVMEKIDDAIVARTDLGIREPKDLEGKSIAILRGTTSHRFADLFVDFYGLDRDAIEFVNLSPPSIQASLIQGTIPAGSIWQPFRYNVETTLEAQSGASVVQFNDPEIYTASALLAMRSELVEQRASDVENFLRALIMAEEYVRNNADIAIAMMSDVLKVDKDVLQSYWSDYSLNVHLRTSLQNTFEEEGMWIKKQDGFEANPLPDYQNVLNPKPLRRVDPGRILP